MKLTERILWATTIVLADLLIFVVPLTAVVAAYVLIARPVWFSDFIKKLYQAE